MKVRVFSTGRVRLKRSPRGVRRYLDDDWSEATLPVNIVLVEHPAGICLIDAGQSAAAAEPGYFPAWYPFFRLARFELAASDEAASQLASIGVPSDRVRWVVFTHLHTDHVGGVAAFPDAELVVAKREWRDFSGWLGRLRGYLPQYWPTTARPRTVTFDGPPIGPFAWSHDLVGDGRIVLVPLPGHTRGHTGVLLRDPAARSYLCIGDAAHTAAEFTKTSQQIAAWCLAERISVLASHDDHASTLAG